MKSNWATEYYDMPYASKGREADGVDCWGLVCLIYKQELGITVPKLTGQDTTHDTRFKPVSLCDVKEFDVVLFKNRDVGGSHVGIVLNPIGWMLHATATGIACFRIGSYFNKQPEYYRWQT